MFNFLRNHQTIFQSSCTIWHSHQQFMKVSPSPHPQQHLFFILPIPVCVKYYLIVVLNCISLMTNDVEHLFMCLLAICISSLREWLFKTFTQLKIRLFVLLLLNHVFIYFRCVDMCPLYDICVGNIFFPVCGLPFFVVVVLFCFWDAVLIHCPGWSAMAWSWFTATSTFRVQVILLLQPPQ